MRQEKKNPRQLLIRRLTINITEPEFEALKSMAAVCGVHNTREYLQCWIREHLLKDRLAKHDQEAQQL